MADAVTLARAIIEIGTHGVSDAEKQLLALDTELKKVGTDYAAGTIKIDEYLAKSQRLQSQIKELTSGLDTAKEALKKYGSAAAATAALGQQTAQSNRNVGMGFLELSRAIEDAQYGLRGVLNNIPTTIQLFGGSAGLAAAVSTAAVAFTVLQPHIQTLLKGLGLIDEQGKFAVGSIEALQERIKELESKTIRVAVETAEIDDAKQKLKDLEEAQRAYEASREGKTVFEKEAGEAAAAGIEAEGPRFSEAQKRIQEIKVQELAAHDKEFLKARKAEQAAASLRAGALEMLNGATSPAEQAAANEMMQIQDQVIEAAQAKQARIITELRKRGGKADKAVGGLLAKVRAGNDADARNVLAGYLRQVGEHDLAAMIELASPEEMERQHGIETGEQESLDRLRAGKALAKKHAEKLREKLNTQAQQNEVPSLKENRKLVEEHNKAVSHIAAAFGPRYAEPLKAAALGRIAKGEGDEAIAKALKEQVQGALRAAGVNDAKVAQEAASKIVASVVDGMRAGLMTLGPNVTANAKNALADLNIKRDRRQDQGEQTRGIEALAQQIQANSLGATGVQFTEEQAREAAKATADMVNHNVNFNVALQSALSQQLMAMHEMGGRLIQQQMQMQALASGFGNVARQLRARQRTALSTPGG